MIKITIPAGKYLLADPCQVLGYEEYDKVCLGDDQYRVTDGILVISTGGDGVFDYYNTDDAGVIIVDSGQVALIPNDKVQPGEWEGIWLETDGNIVIRDDAIGIGPAGGLSLSKE